MCDIDLILVSNAINNFLRNLTLNAIKSCANKANIIVVESNKNVKYPDSYVIHPDEPFNYNRYLNLGASKGKSDFIFFGNNDILFYNNWDKEILKEMSGNNAESASPICPLTHSIFDITINSGIYTGYDLISRFCGWAFIWTRSLYRRTGGLSEEYLFWCSDNIVVEQLKKINAKHILVSTSIVNHYSMGRNTLKYMTKETQALFTRDQTLRFEKSHGDWRTKFPSIYEV